jgi:hypothetical protein
MKDVATALVLFTAVELGMFKVRAAENKWEH